MKVFEFTTVNLSHTKKYRTLDLSKGSIKSVFWKRTSIEKNYFTGIMLLHKFEIFESNLKAGHEGTIKIFRALPL
jgi:hypothetical protein